MTVAFVSVLTMTSLYNKRLLFVKTLLSRVNQKAGGNEF